MSNQTIKKTYSRTPKPVHSYWDAVQHADEIAPGWWHVMTAGHGGSILSPERVKAIPRQVLEATFNGNGLRGNFEEDCDYVVPIVFFAEEYRAHCKLTQTNAEEVIAYATRRVEADYGWRVVAS